MMRLPQLLVLSALTVANTTLRAQTATQTAPQTAPQTATQTQIQSGPQTGMIPLPKSGPGNYIPLPMPAITPGQLELIKLESDFSEAVAKGGGKAFASWFADDAVTLNNGEPPVLGRRNIAATTTWDPKAYQLSWYVEGAQMMPSNDTGFTWGHYDATTVDPKTGKSSTASGRYFTFWKKVAGKWKVALDASANEPPVLPALPALPPAATTPPR
jgi:ketosteroid isomerase-like protein